MFLSEAERRRRKIHRLFEMVVEEVSLVDRAANKHKFLIRKRKTEGDKVEPEKLKELLGGLPGLIRDGAEPAALVEALRKAADDVEAAAGLAKAEEPAKPAEPAKPEEPKAVEAVVETAVEKTAEPVTVAEPQPDLLVGITAQLAEIMSEIKTLGTSGAQLDQRLAAVEKSVDVPNSLPVETQLPETRGIEEDVVWPTNLNDLPKLETTPTPTN
jgi:hypothetical protein